MDIATRINEAIKTNISVMRRMIESPEIAAILEKVCNEITNAFKHDKKVLFCGNGGSAADAQHLAAEFSGKFYIDRRPLFAEALHVNTSYLTAVANDYSYDEVFSRLVQAKGRGGDVLVGLSTSGNSRNVIKAIQAANELGMTSVGLTNEEGGKMNGLCRHLLRVPSRDTPRVQEAHILLGHIICQIVEKDLFDRA